MHFDGILKHSLKAVSAVQLPVFHQPIGPTTQAKIDKLWESFIIVPTCTVTHLLVCGTGCSCSRSDSHSEDCLTHF